MITFLKLVRIQNLIIIAGTQYLMRWTIINPLLKHFYAIKGEELVNLTEFELQFNGFYFSLLVLSTILLTAAGYVINDYFDTKTDILNRPETVVVGKIIPRRYAMTIHIILNILGVGLGFFIAWKVNILSYGLIFILVAGLLWFYSTTYKRQFLIGNLVVATLTGLVPFIVVLFEIPLLNQAYGPILVQTNTNFNILVAWVGGFSFFAFLSTLAREIFKDIEDFEGDSAYGRKTLPVVIGLNSTKFVVVILNVIIIVCLIIIYLKYLTDYFTLVYLTAALILPYLFLTYKIIKADSRKDYHFASTLYKITMLSGVLYSVVACIIINKTF
jgi:4-hydroxybenzoate polyprenyltransferase